jgi:ATP synthase F1 complex assembly factor 2
VKWSKEHLELDVKLCDSILIGKQPEESRAKLLAVLSEFDQWRMAGGLLIQISTFILLTLHHGGYERAVYTTKSALISLALVRQRLTVEQAAQAAHVEVNSQIERWGEVEDCE